MSSRSRGSKTWLLAMIPLVFLCRETQQIVKNFVNSSTPHLRPTFVVNFDTSTVICQHSSDPTDLHIHNMSSLCDGKQDCFVNPAMHDEVFPYCEHKCDSTCSGNGACLYDGAKPQCYCDSGFSGSACELRDKNECLEHPCHLMAQCQNTLGSYECRCLPGYQGTGHECSDIDECADKLAFRCPDHSQCINLPGTYYCNCTQGFNPKGNQGSGLDKCVDINECETGAHDCLASELCENTIGSFKCVSKCSPGYEFLAGKCEDVDECASKSLNKCDIRAECINTIGGYKCECEEGFDGDGKNCQPKSSCRKNPTICDRHAHCHIVLDICDCKTGYAGDGITCHDINECDAKETPCAGGGRCLNLDGGYVCCKDGQDDGECIKDQGAFCSGGCGDNAICSNSTCECVSGFRGDPQKKCVDINECEENDSICGGVGDRCVNLFGGFKCCQHGTKDPECSTDQAFSSDSSTISSHGADFTTTGEQIIEGSGSIQTSSGGTITVTRGLIPKDVELTTSGKLACTSYCPANSECVAGYCECVKGYGGNALVGCEDIDECITETCNEEENEWCVNLIGGFVCCNPTNATQDDCLGLEITREKGMHLIGGNEEDTVVATRSNHSTSDQLITQVVQQSRNFSSGQIILTRGKVNSGEAVTQTSDVDEFGLEISALDLAGSGSGVGIIKSTTTLTPVKEMPTGVWTEEEDGEDEDLMEEGSGSNSWSTTINGTGFTGAPRSEGTIRVRITTLGEDGETETATKPGVSVPLTTTVSGEGSGETSTVPAKSSGVSESVKASGESGSSSSGSSATSGESSGSSGNVTSAGKSEVGTPSSSAEESGSSGTSTSSREGSGESVSLGSTNSTSSGGGSESGNVTSTEESGSSGSSSSGSSESSGSTSTGTSTSGSTTSSQSVSSGSSVAPEEGSGTSESTTLPGEKPGSPESKEENLAVNKKNEEATSSGSVKVSKTEIEGSGSGEWFESGSKGHFESGTKVTVTSSEKSPEEPESSGKPKKPKTDKDQPDITTDGEDSSSSTAGGEKRPKGDSHSEKPKTDDKDHEHGKGKGDEDKEISKGNITTSSGGKNTTLEHGKTKVPAEKPTSSEIGLEISAGHKNEPDTSKETGLEIVWESTTTTPDPDNVGLEISGTDLAKSTKQPIEGSGTGDEEITATTRDVSKSTKRPRVAIDGGDNEESEGIDGLGGKPKTTAKPTPIETSSASPAGSGELPEGSGESAVSTTTPKESTTSVSGVEGSGETSTSSSSSVTESTLSSGVSEVTTSSESTLAPEGSGETPTPQPATISPQSREEPKPTKETFALPTTTTTQAPANKTIENTKCTSSDECGMDALCERRTGVCRCEPGFEGAPPKQACVDVDECATGDHKCHETARCQNFIGGYACFCPTGFRKTDDGSCEDIDECTEHNSTCCGANAKCVNKPGTYSCECEHGFLGDGYHCVPNTKKPCDSEQSVKSHCAESNMSCEVDTKDGAVECKECMGGYKKSGKMCEDINECDASESPCSSNAHCTNLNGTFSCSCKPGFRGDGFQCTDINECDERHPCHPHAECTNLEGSFKCECHSGFEGDGVKKCTNPLERSCEDVEKFCGRVEHVSCLSVRVYNGSLSSVCECEPGFRFDKENNKCVDIDECDENRNNCDPASAVCVNTEGSFRCECAEGYEGEGGVCTDIDECDRGMAGCDSMAMCINRMGSCGCKCMSGYTGDGVHCTKIEEPKSEKSTCTDEWSRLCELEKKQCTVDEEEVPQCGACLPGHHPINGTCQSLQISGLCVQKNDCNKHAVCIDILPDSHFCSCPDGFIGDGMMCDDVDECNNAGMCEDKNSQCENTIGSFNCVCDPGYKKEGDVCVAEKKAPNREKIEIDEETSSSTSSGAEKPTTQSSVATESTSTTVVTEAATKSSENGTSSETTTSSSSTEKLESSTSPESSTVLSKTSESTTTKVPSSGEPVSVSSTVPSKPVPSTSSGKSESTSLLPESTTQSVTLSSSTTENAIASSEAPETTKKLSESKTTSSSKSSPESSTVSSISPETTTKESGTTASGALGSSTTLTAPTKPVTESTGSPTTTKAPEASTKSLEVDTSSSEATVATSTTSATTTKSSKGTTLSSSVPTSPQAHVLSSESPESTSPTLLSSEAPGKFSTTVSPSTLSQVATSSLKTTMSSEHALSTAVFSAAPELHVESTKSASESTTLSASTTQSVILTSELPEGNTASSGKPESTSVLSETTTHPVSSSSYVPEVSSISSQTTKSLTKSPVSSTFSGKSESTSLLKTTTSSSSTENLESSTVLSKTSESTTSEVTSSGESVSSTVPSKPVPSTSSGKSESTSLLPESTTQPVTLSIASSQAPEATKSPSEVSRSPIRATLSSELPVETTTTSERTTAASGKSESTSVLSVSTAKSVTSTPESSESTPKNSTATTYSSEEPVSPTSTTVASLSTTASVSSSTEPRESTSSSEELVSSTSALSSESTLKPVTLPSKLSETTQSSSEAPVSSTLSLESSTTTTTITTTPASSTTSVPQAKVTSTTTSEPTESTLTVSVRIHELTTTSPESTETVSEITESTKSTVGLITAAVVEGEKPTSESPSTKSVLVTSSEASYHLSSPSPKFTSQSESPETRGSTQDTVSSESTTSAVTLPSVSTTTSLKNVKPSSNTRPELSTSTSTTKSPEVSITKSISTAGTLPEKVTTTTIRTVTSSGKSLFESPDEEDTKSNSTEPTVLSTVPRKSLSESPDDDLDGAQPTSTLETITSSISSQTQATSKSKSQTSVKSTTPSKSVTSVVKSSTKTPEATTSFSVNVSLPEKSLSESPDEEGSGNSTTESSVSPSTELSTSKSPNAVTSSVQTVVPTQLPISENATSPGKLLSESPDEAGSASVTTEPSVSSFTELSTSPEIVTSSEPTKTTSGKSLSESPDDESESITTSTSSSESTKRVSLITGTPDDEDLIVTHGQQRQNVTSSPVTTSFSSSAASSESPTTKPSTSPLPPSSVTTTTTKPIIEHRGPPSIQPPPELFTTTSSEAPVPSNGGYGEETNQEEEEEKATTTTEIPSLCSNITCHSLATCEPSSGTCICRDGFIGDGTTGCSKKSSADCVSLPSLCAENARCDNATKSCECEPGYIGDGYVCSPHPQDCILRQNLCSPEAICQNRRCQCLPGFTGDGVKCVSIHERASNCSQCDQNAHCVGGETCKCNNGYFGNGLCCVPDPLDCVHFTGICHPNAECNQESRQCECSSGFSGNGVSCFPQKSCRTDKSVCAKNAICLPTGHCICRHGFKGDPFYKCNSIILKEPQSLDLSDVTSCAVPCDPTSQLCISGECVCKKGFRLNSTLSTSSDQCVDVDECAERTHNCDRVATCHNTIGSHVCTCPDGHIGDGTTCVPHVNKGKLSVYCEADGMTLVLGNETSEFEGKIFVKGQAENPHCSKSFSSLLNSHKPYVFKVAFQHCDVQLLENHTMASTVVVQKHAMFLTNKADSYDLRCQYPIGSRAVESHVNVSELATTSTLTDKNSTLAPICRLSVSNDQQLSISSATVGDTLKLALEVTPSDNFGILPRNCFAVNIESGERYTLTDDHGCAIDESLFPQWSVASTSKVQAVFRTFKWPDSSMIRFQCDCVPCIGQCSVPSCISSARFRRHQTNHPIVSDDIRQELILMSGVESLAVSSIINVHDTNDNSEDTHVAPSHFQDSTSICVKMAPLFVAIASFAVFSVIMLYLCSKKPKTIKEGSEIGY
uniref:FiBrilliN homolog n=1 Tax=Caenorhabditis japonica TaxID=281687 RepID=A0A8R1DNL8_CAEJA